MYTHLHPLLNEIAASGVQADALETSYRLCSDYISSFLLGYGSGTNYLSREQRFINEWRLHYDNYSCHECFFPQEMPLFYSLLKGIGIDMLPRSYWTSKKFLEAWLREMMSKADETIRQKEKGGRPVPPENEPVVYETINMAVEKDSPQLDKQAKQAEVASELFDHICKSSSYTMMKWLLTHLGAHVAASREVLGT